jgi:hypothetical protein
MIGAVVGSVITELLQAATMPSIYLDNVGYHEAAAIRPFMEQRDATRKLESNGQKTFVKSTKINLTMPKNATAILLYNPPENNMNQRKDIDTNETTVHKERVNATYESNKTAALQDDSGQVALLKKERVIATHESNKTAVHQDKSGQVAVLKNETVNATREPKKTAVHQDNIGQVAVMKKAKTIETNHSSDAVIKSKLEEYTKRNKFIPKIAKQPIFVDLPPPPELQADDQVATCLLIKGKSFKLSKLLSINVLLGLRRKSYAA